MSKIKLYLFVFTLLITFSAVAQPPKLENSTLWEITGKNLKKPSYLFGTIHLIEKKDFLLSETTKGKLKSCQILATEIDLNMSFWEQIKLSMMAFLPDGKTWKDYMSEAEYHKLTQYMADSLKIKPKKIRKLSRIKPFFASAMISTGKMKKMVSYEKKLNQLSKKQHKEILGLETAEFQMKLIDQIPVEDQIQYLMQDVNTGNSTGFDELVKIYKSQNITKLNEITTTDADSSFNELFLLKRNKNWIPKIIQLATAESTFIAVGAAHLGGEFGVINLLRKRGYSVEAVKH